MESTDLSEDLVEVKGLSSVWLLCFSDFHLEPQYLSLVFYYSCHRARINGAHYCTGFIVASGDQNSGPHTCVASVSATEPSPKLSLGIFYINDKISSFQKVMGVFCCFVFVF